MSIMVRRKKSFREETENAARVVREERERLEAPTREHQAAGRALRDAALEAARQRRERDGVELPANAAAREWRQQQGYGEPLDLREARVRAAIDAQNQARIAQQQRLAEWDTLKAEAEGAAHAAGAELAEAIRNRDVAAAVEAQIRLSAAEAVVGAIEEERKRNLPHGNFVFGAQRVV
jgi:hypothetical protein